MSETDQNDAAPTGENQHKHSHGKDEPKTKRILLVPFPKFIFMYPTLIVSAVASIVLAIGGYSAVDPATQTTPVLMTGIFLSVMLANFFVIVFDFPRATSLTLVFIGTTFVLGIWMLLVWQPEMMPRLASLLQGVRPAANATFFHCTTIAMLVMYAAMFISTKFNYWELRNNELLHHHGLLSDLKRYPAPNLRVDKEINDVFEFMLLGAGRLILHPSTEKRAIVLDNILFVSKKEAEMTRMLGSIKVKIGGDSGH